MQATTERPMLPLACIAYCRAATEVTEPTEKGTYGRFQIID